MEAKKALAKGIAKSASNIDWEGVELKVLNEQRWEEIVTQEMKRLKMKAADIASSAQGAEWKVTIAKRLRKETTAKNPWIAERLQMGHPNYVSNLINK